MSTAHAKSDLRELARERRRARWSEASELERRSWAEVVSERVRAHPVVAAAALRGETVASYASMPGEPPTATLNADLTADGASVLLPVVDPEASGILAWRRLGSLDNPDGPDNLMVAASSDDHAHAVGQPHPLEPVADRLVCARSPADLFEHRTRVIVVPALATDAYGYRVGQGGGYYDRLIAGLRDVGAAQGRLLPRILAVVWEDELVARVPREAHDALIDEVVTIPA